MHHVMVDTVVEDNVGGGVRPWCRLGPADRQRGGRHYNDKMFSFYVVTPAGFQLEFGHGVWTISMNRGSMTAGTTASACGVTSRSVPAALLNPVGRLP